MKQIFDFPKEEFTGTGEVKGFEFIRLKETDKGFLYQVEDEGNIYYEIFKAKPVPLCIDFEKKLFSNTHFKYSYPKARDFGVWAWTTKSLEKAEEIFNQICEN